MGITEWQTALYAVNELPDWRFPDHVLLVRWLIRVACRRWAGASHADDKLGGAEHYIGVTRKRYNAGTYRHGGPAWPTSHQFSPKECLQIRA